MAAPLARRLGVVRTIQLPLIAFVGLSLVLLAIAWTGGATLPVLMVFLFMAYASLGLVMPVAFVMALEEHGAVARLASSLSGTLQMVVGALLVTVSAPFSDGTPMPMVATVAACGMLALLTCLGMLWRLPAPASASPTATR